MTEILGSARERTSQTVLLLIAKNEPLEGAIRTAIVQENARVIIYHINYGIFLPGSPGTETPRFPVAESGLRTFFLSRYITKCIHDGVITRVVAVGMKSADFWKSLQINALEPQVVLQQDDVDFSQKRQELAKQFERASQLCLDYFFEDPFLFTTAISHGSRSRHFVYDIPVGASKPFLAPIADQKKIALIHPKNINDELLQFWSEKANELSVASGWQIDFIEDTALFNLSDFNLARNFSGTLRYRLSEYSRLGFVSYSRNTSVLLKAVRDQANHVVLEQSYWARRWNAKHGAVYDIVPALDLLHKLIEPRPFESSPYKNSSQGFLDCLSSKAGAQTHEHFEEFSAATGLGFHRFSVFFSTSSIDLTTAGARPQRIRHMFEALLDKTECLIPVTSNFRVLERRTQFIAHLTSQRYNPVYFYGENSTTPIRDVKCISLLNKLLSILKAKGAKAGWFVRDLHFFHESLLANLHTAAAQSAMRTLAKLEADIADQHCDIIFAPSERSAADFRMLLRLDRGPVPKPWAPLPPAVRPSSQVPVGLGPRDDTTTTFVYAGGIGPIYELDNYFQAIRHFSERDDVAFDFIVRAAEREALETKLAATQTNNFRIFTGDLDHYAPYTRRTIGVLLLNGDYVAAGFPYKCASYMERGFPILTYEETTVGEFVESNRIGKAVAKDVDSLVQAMNAFILDSETTFDWSKALAENSWEARVTFLISALNNTGRFRALLPAGRT